jgi:hypothetical protein
MRKTFFQKTLSPLRKQGESIRGVFSGRGAPMAAGPRFGSPYCQQCYHRRALPPLTNAEALFFRRAGTKLID